jgi:glycosyltransferase A (GT-A) superfamily protein (DUF2064 family)
VKNNAPTLACNCLTCYEELKTYTDLEIIDVLQLLKRHSNRNQGVKTMRKNHDTCILLVIKYPEKGKVKLRLSKALDEDIVLEMYRCFVQDTLTTVKKINVPFFICFHPPDAQGKFQSWLGSTLLFLPQKGKDLGERMKNSFTDVFTKGYQKAILMGGDSPDLPVGFIKQAIITLQTKDVVLGPTRDGGHYQAFEQRPLLQKLKNP